MAIDEDNTDIGGDNYKLCIELRYSIDRSSGNDSCLPLRCCCYCSDRRRYICAKTGAFYRLIRRKLLQYMGILSG